MENNARTNDESLDSDAQPTFKALQEESAILGSLSRTVEKEGECNLLVSAQKENELYESDHDMDKESLSQSHGNETNDQNINEEDISLEYEEEDEEICDEYLPDGSETCMGPITADSKNDALIVQGNDGMIKKIKICNNTKDIIEKPENKTNKFLSCSQPETSNNTILLPRSSTPMSREFLALQKSVNESKILTEFVTDAASEKPRKLRGKDSASSLASSNADHSYSTKKNSPEKAYSEELYNNLSPSQGKRQYSKRYAPLKDSDSDVDSSANLRPRSRSKSMHNSEFNLSGGVYKKLKKWPSEERLHKRTNMRSENSEFAQKQAEFLQRVIQACENPRRRSRSRSCGRKTPSLLNEPVSDGNGGGSSGQQHKTNKTSSKERYPKRLKYEMGSENDEQLLGENNSEQPDEEYITESQASLTNSPGDISLADNKEVEAHLKSVWQPSPKPGYDSFCWKCHENKVNLCCCKCIRSFHAACVKISKFDNIWLCPECTTVENLLNNPKRPKRNDLSLDLLSQLLSFALKRMRYTKGHYSFVMPYEESTTYRKYIVNPVSLSGLQAKIEGKEFRCAEEFVNETKWMLHNAYILSSRNNTKIVLTAKSIFKICRQEANEIETCAECYLNANTRTDWFLDVCSQPHLLLWAKLKGFPYWPAKAMGLGQNSLINVRFFGEHDRAFVPLKDCFLYSEQDPNTATGKRAARELADCVKEVEEHITKIRSKVGGFKYAPFKTPYEPAEEIKQLTEMMPGVVDFMKKQQGLSTKPSLQFKIYKTADNNLSIVQKACATPELTASPSVETEEKERKKKSNSESDCKKTDDSSVLPANYEVISKVGPDDSSTSKLGTVILKRKSINGDSKKVNEDETIDLPLPKMTKIEDQSLEESLSRMNAKRKIEIQSPEKPKAKHTKLDVKVPIITIKNSAVKDSAEIPNKELNTQCLAALNESVNYISKQVTDTQENVINKTPEIASESQKVVESLVKQGVTVKKIVKDSQTPNSVEQNTLNTSNEKINQSPKDKNESKQNSEDEKAQENLKVNNILKGLIPFVEVKKEVLTDNEEDEEKTKNDQPCDKESNMPAVEGNKENSQIMEQNLVNNSQTENDISNNSNKPDNDTTEKEKSTEKLNDTAVVTQVKQEVLSDEENTNDKNVANASVNQATAKTIQIKISDKRYTITPTPNPSPADIRVVGDTTIQKLPNKGNNGPHYYIYSTKSSTNNAGINSTNDNNNLGVTTKRFSLKGVPYGPLPASATPKVSVSKSFHQTDTQQPRAKKSFPQQSPPAEKLRINNNQNTITDITPPKPIPLLEPKRTMGNNTMVTIPVDVAVNRTATSSGTVVIGSIPVPPLTAVSKPMPSSLAHSSTARNSPTTITVSGSSASLTTPTVMVQAKPSTTISTTSTSVVRNSPITITTLSTLTPLTSSTSSLPSTPVMTTTAATTLNPLKMTTPPPLAGLSNSSLISTTQTNGILDLNNTAIISSLPVIQQQPSTESHILGGLVTPTLASAITDVICRGPPKLAARPNGPLQSEGYPMFPSQAGPVCKRLVENVHKESEYARKRAKNYTAEEEILLVDLVESHKSILANKKSDAVVWKQKEEAWRNIAKEFEARMGIHRHWKALRDKYIMVRKKSRSEMAEQKSETYRTGGGVPTAKLSDVSVKIASMMGDSATGLQNHIDSDYCKLTFENENEEPAENVDKCKTSNVELTDFFTSVVEDTMGEMAQGDDACLQAKITLLTIELERKKQAYEQEIAELKRTSDLMLCEMRKSMENEKTRLVVEVRKQCEMERLRSVEETKRKQWCANCFREANFYCCWNTSYCDYPCQQLHWARHSHTCAQTRPSSKEATNAATATTQAERHHSNKSNSTITLSSTANFNKSTTISQKKEKGTAKNSTNHMMSSSITTVTTPSASRPEVLKLPTNTYLRPVANNLNNQTLRCNTTYSLPIQRFNAPMPITTPANSNSPQTYTIVQQGNSWVMSSTTNNGTNNNSATSSSTISTQNANSTQVTGPTRSGAVITNKATKTQIRYH